MGPGYDDMVEVYDLAIRGSPSPQKWGFFIFRTTYKDEGLWNNYITHIRHQASLFLRRQEHASELMSHLNLTVMDDATLLDGASKDEVREIFRKMVYKLPEEGDPANGIPDADEREDTPRYTQCVYVDDECLESYSQLDWGKVGELRQRLKLDEKEDFTWFEPDPFLIVLNCQDDDDERLSRYPEDEDAAPDIEEGMEEVDMSWMPVECRWLTLFYAKLVADWYDYWEDGFYFCNPGEDEPMRPWRDALDV
ncbi:hypothetical protein F5X68DRAFT_237134 [Plectosphaerella plurivora]|uniref:Uncharacterized protein n=1 Tax=Plectosphaerella plurivora TaxID=936078 RepID=A0A9P8V2R7_9PEZI|nr:hypothetical protein F5X68DRAFT_237134 [Plectosphaerella plurivora]